MSTCPWHPDHSNSIHSCSRQCNLHRRYPHLHSHSQHRRPCQALWSSCRKMNSVCWKGMNVAMLKNASRYVCRWFLSSRIQILTLNLHPQLLRNIQLLMDASFSLMSQYSTISACFPPPAAPTPTPASQPTSEQPGTAVSDPIASSSISKQTDATPAASTSNASDKTTTPVASTSGIETIRSHSPPIDDTNKPSTSSASVIDENKVTIEDLGRDEDNANDSDTASELRRRRLQKFLKVEQDQ